MRVFILCFSIVILQGCAAATPLLVAQGAAYSVARNDEDIRLRSAAALADEADLLTYSALAIARGSTQSAINTYLTAFSNPDYSEGVKLLAIYQVALIQMNRFNDSRDDHKARAYLTQILSEYPGSKLQQRVEQRLSVLNKRHSADIQTTPSQLLKQIDRQKLLGKKRQAFSHELTPLSERAIEQKRTQEAESVYLSVYQNRASSQQVRAKALYQIGLMYSSPFNLDSNADRARYYFDKIRHEFPDSDIADKSGLKITELVNQQS